MALSCLICVRIADSHVVVDAVMLCSILAPFAGFPRGAKQVLCLCMAVLACVQALRVWGLSQTLLMSFSIEAGYKINGRHITIGDIKKRLATNSAYFGAILCNLQCELSDEAGPV